MSCRRLLLGPYIVRYDLHVGDRFEQMHVCRPPMDG